MIQKIAHLSDIHVERSVKRHNEYRKVFEKTYEELRKRNPDRIVITGDLYHNFLEINGGESFLLMSEFLNELSKIAKCLIIRGNHDLSKMRLDRIDIIGTLISLIQNDNVIFFNESNFYLDDNVVWVVHDYGDKLNPWKDIEHKKDENKIYIDLFHDPIYGASNEIGYKFEKGNLRKLSDFQGSWGFFGDLHLPFQYLNKEKTFVYPGSLLQRNFGEGIKHGFLIHNIIDKKSEEIIIENTEHAFLTFRTKPGLDYDNLNLKPDEFSTAKELEVRVIWNEQSSLETKENEYKLKKYIYDNYPNTVSIRLEKDIIYTSVIDGKMLSETIDINNTNVQKEIITEYLIMNDYDDKVVKNILELDELINDKLNITKISNITWNIEKMWFNNFKSYGDNVVIDWGEISGVVQITGINQQGKSTILDAICYILYGTTISTQKREKNGDNRYININRDLDYCDGGLVIDVNGEKFTIYRRTDRKVKDGDIKSCVTKLEYYTGVGIDEDNILTDENRVTTQKLLDDVLGDFSDFVRLSLTNADNLNETLSMDRSVFIDSLIRDAGLDIFDLKLNEFKEYKKSLNLERINIDIETEELFISEHTEKIKEYEENLYEVNTNIYENHLKIKKLQKEKDVIVGTLNKIDESVIGIDISDLEEIVENSKNKIETKNIRIKDIDTIISTLPESFDYDNYNVVTEKYKEYLEKYNTGVLKSKDIESNIDKLDTKLYKLNNSIDNVTNEIKQKSLDDIRQYESDIKTLIENKKIELEKLYDKYNYDKKLLSSEFDKFKEEGIKIKDDIKKLQSSDGDVKICPMCKQTLNTKEDIDHIQNEININESKLTGIYENAKLKKKDIESLNEKLISIKSDVELLDSEDYTKYDDLIEKINILKGNIKTLKESILNINDDRIVEYKKDIVTTTNEQNELKTQLTQIVESNNKLYDIKIRGEKKIKELNEVKKQFDNKKELLSEKNTILLDINNMEKNIRDTKDKIKLYGINLVYIEENDKINIEINNKNSEINIVEEANEELLNKKIDYNNSLTLTQKIISDIKDKIVKYKKQQEIEFLYDTYVHIMHRNGIPTFLLKKSIHIINNELFNLLSNVNFNLYFTDGLDLKLASKLQDKEVNAISSSGMERTFSSCALKMALRNINVNSKPDFMFLDEVVNRLVGDSVSQFTDLLDVMKQKIDKILIIEHIHPVNYDVVIDVVKDENGISSLDIHR